MFLIFSNITLLNFNLFTKDDLKAKKMSNKKPLNETSMLSSTKMFFELFVGRDRKKKISMFLK